MTLRPAKPQISLGIRPVRSVFACVQWIAKEPSFLHADREDSDQTEQMPGLILVSVARTCNFVGFVMSNVFGRKYEQDHVKRISNGSGESLGKAMLFVHIYLEPEEVSDIKPH